MAQQKIRALRFRTLAQLIIAVIGHNSTPTEAVSNFRIHHQAWPDILYREKVRSRESTFRALSKMGYKIKEKDEPIGDIHGVFRQNGEYCAVSDYRREGRSLAY